MYAVSAKAGDRTKAGRPPSAERSDAADLPLRLSFLVHLCFLLDAPTAAFLVTSSDPQLITKTLLEGLLNLLQPTGSSTTTPSSCPSDNNGTAVPERLIVTIPVDGDPVH